MVARMARSYNSERGVNAVPRPDFDHSLLQEILH
jgi:hypothetical protein